MHKLQYPKAESKDLNSCNSLLFIVNPIFTSRVFHKTSKQR